MPLLSGEKNIGHNVEVEEAAGKPHKQAVAIALSKARGKDSALRPVPVADRVLGHGAVGDAETGVCKVCGKTVPTYKEGSKMVANMHRRPMSSTGYATECSGSFKAVAKDATVTTTLAPVPVKRPYPTSVALPTREAVEAAYRPRSKKELSAAFGKDSLRSLARDSFYGRNLAPGPGETAFGARLNAGAARAYDAAAGRDAIDPKTVSRVYSGRPGCMCGCRGNHSTNPVTIAQICKKIDALGGQSTRDWHTAQTPTRTYTAYLKSGWPEEIRRQGEARRQGMAAKDAVGTWTTKPGRAKGVVTHVLRSSEGDPGFVNDYTTTPKYWANGKKFETEEPRSYGGAYQWFSTLDAAKRAVEKAVEKSEVYWKAYKAKHAKDSLRPVKAGMAKDGSQNAREKERREVAEWLERNKRILAKNRAAGFSESMNQVLLNEIEEAEAELRRLRGSAKDALRPV